MKKHATNVTVRSRRLLLSLVIACLALASGVSHAIVVDYVYLYLESEGVGTVWDPNALTRSFSDARGTAFASASLSDGFPGFLKAQVVAPDPSIGFAGAVAGVNTRIYLGNTGVAGAVEVTMTTTGFVTISSDPGPWFYQVYLQSGGGIPIENASGPDPGFAGLAENLGFYVPSVFAGSDIAEVQSLPGTCGNCMYTLGQILPASVTAILPYEAGATHVDYRGELLLRAGLGATVDATGTAVFSIEVPDGVTYTSALQFVEAPTGVPEPGSLALLVAALTGLGLARRRKAALEQR